MVLNRLMSAWDTQRVQTDTVTHAPEHVEGETVGEEDITITSSTTPDGSSNTASMTSARGGRTSPGPSGSRGGMG